jgi:hypothetical protein
MIIVPNFFLISEVITNCKFRKVQLACLKTLKRTQKFRSKSPQNNLHTFKPKGGRTLQEKPFKNVNTLASHIKSHENLNYKVKSKEDSEKFINQ